MRTFVILLIIILALCPSAHATNLVVLELSNPTGNLPAVATTITTATPFVTQEFQVPPGFTASFIDAKCSVASGTVACTITAEYSTQTGREIACTDQGGFSPTGAISISGTTTKSIGTSFKPLPAAWMRFRIVSDLSSGPVTLAYFGFSWFGSGTNERGNAYLYTH